MAMRQAGAEAAQKASQKKMTKPGSLQSDNSASPNAPSLSTVADTKLSKASEEPHVSPDMTATKTPAVLAAEGAKRTSVDKIAGSESNTESVAESPKSPEESLLQARRTNSIPKAKTPLANETAVGSPTALSEHRHFEERPRTHRGSSVSDASKEEIECVEKSGAIPEEDEGDEETVDTQKAAEKAAEKQARAAKEDAQPALADVTSSEQTRAAFQA